MKRRGMRVKTKVEEGRDEKGKGYKVRRKIGEWASEGEFCI
jgi:hypothetical protein